MHSVVAISGSPSAMSSTALLVEHVLGMMGEYGVHHRHFRLSTLSPAALLSADLADKDIAEIVGAIEQAEGLIIATPIYKAAYTGLLKAFLDLLPQFALAGKAVLPLATGGSPAHVLALDYGLRPVLQSMGVRHAVQGHYVLSSQIKTAGGKVTLAEEVAAPLGEAVRHFALSLTSDPHSRHLGHPRPPVAPVLRNVTADIAS